KKSIRKVIEAGAVGINFEDQVIDGKELYSIEDQCARIKAIRQEAEHLSVPIFINARTDIFLKSDSINHNDDLLKEALKRAFAYAEAGANGFFAPGLKNIKYIKKLCKLLHIPLNIMVLPDTPSLKQLAELGVARISYGPDPYCQAMEALKIAGIKALSMSV
ncbi:MAG: isocitrate lyase/phosphoenolpyruvate mutase family protein, partial [Parachlamydiaceae bacterium]|nr:isocitrate lyase/phosphoenolpyruvate mutase family protein [Parachlamydiaceae bacterium]